MHFSVHRYGLTMAMLGHIGAVIVWAMMIIACGDDLASLDEDSTKVEAHCRLGGCVGALREVKLRLVHRYRWMFRVKMVNDCEEG